MKLFREKKMLGRNFMTYEDALEATYNTTLTTRDIEVKMDLEDFSKIKHRFNQIKYEAEKKIAEAERKQKEIANAAKKNIIDIKKEIEQEKKEKERLLKTLRKVRKGKNLKPEETGKEELIKAEFLARKEKYLEHWLMPIPAEPELAKVAWQWILKKEWKEYTEKIYFQPGTGWIAVIRTEW